MTQSKKIPEYDCSLKALFGEEAAEILPNDWFIDTVPEVIERVEQAEERGVIKGKAEGKAEGLTEGVLEEARLAVQDVVQARFPSLLPFAQVQVKLLNRRAQLRQLRLDLMQAPDEITAFRLLAGNGQSS